MLEYNRNAITRLPMDRLGRNLGGHIPSCPRHVSHDAVAMQNVHSEFIRLPIDRLGRILSGHIPPCPRHVPHDAVAMATATAYQRRIEHFAVMGVWRPNA